MPRGKKSIKVNPDIEKSLGKTVIALKAMGETWANQQNVALCIVIFQKVQEKDDLSLNEILELKNERRES